MIDEKEIKEAEQNVQQYVQDGLMTKNAAHAQFATFYLNNAMMSLNIAQHLQKLSTDKKTKQQNSFPEDFECFLWVVVTSYYSMFYTANAALATLGLKIGEKIAHKITQDALIVYFLKNKRLAKSLLEDYQETKNEVLNLMNLSEEQLLKEFQIKAEQLVATFNYQRKKRGEFQYSIQSGAKRHVAQLSLDRATTFIQEFNKIIQKK